MQAELLFVAIGSLGAVIGGVLEYSFRIYVAGKRRGNVSSEICDLQDDLSDKADKQRFETWVKQMNKELKRMRRRMDKLEKQQNQDHNILLRIDERVKSIYDNNGGGNT